MSKPEHRFHDVGDTYTCGTCLRQWCGLCDPTPSARCPFEYEHDDEQECGRCGDYVYTLSSDGLCDGCMAEDYSRPTLTEEAERLLGYWEQHGSDPDTVAKWAVSDIPLDNALVHGVIMCRYGR